MSYAAYTHMNQYGVQYNEIRESLDLPCKYRDKTIDSHETYLGTFTFIFSPVHLEHSRSKAVNFGQFDKELGVRVEFVKILRRQRPNMEIMGPNHAG